ncbi:dTDP-4-dehydrorhamnose 3,5-epimerase [Paenibacillus filicis]|uniref:dTDP-4-dehydrorhamnose 3,5-epimerase n=1 Tax=Paenibacillus filicis TaxID=669464 RepID=A0ABU9DQD6_9BACL
MNIISTKLDGVFIIEPPVFGDNRGFFLESYNAAKFEQAGLHFSFVQDNHSLSVEAGIIRGLHYQLQPKAQTKLVRVAAGAIYDVAVDIRQSSPSFGKWVGVILSASNKRQLLVPKGFAHGFCTLVPNTEVLYKVDELYSPEHDRGIAWNDHELAIDWPTQTPILSIKDGTHPALKDAKELFE